VQHGIGFVLSLGNNIEDFCSGNSIATNRQPILLSGHVEQKMREGMVKAFGKSRANQVVAEIVGDLG